MLTRKPIQSVCLSCRFRLLSAANGARLQSTNCRSYRQTKFFAKGSLTERRTFSIGQQRNNAVNDTTNVYGQDLSLPPQPTSQNRDARVRAARRTFGETLPKDYLSEDELKVYERLYGRPLFTLSAEDRQGRDLQEEEAHELGLRPEDEALVLLRKNKDGELEEVEYDSQEAELHTGYPGNKETEEDVEEFEDEEIGDYLEELDAETPVRHRGDYTRTHPLTEAGRFGTFPQTLQLPRETLIKPTAALLTNASNKQLIEMSERIFGGKGLPYSLATPRLPPATRQMPVALDAGQADMGRLESDVYLATIMPGAYASIMATLVEARKRLGSGWIENLVRKKGGPLVLDAGAGGAGILAWRDVLRAEWDRLQEDHPNLRSRGPSPPGKATVLAGSDMLRHKVSQLLDNTQFLPRLPETVFPGTESSGNSRKMYDLIIAPNTLWGIKEDYIRRQHIQRLWSLLNPEGGVLVLIEKGLPRGFEMIADARHQLLEKFIETPEKASDPQYQHLERPEHLNFKKEPGMIVAPCTNHVACPMYKEPGENKGRKDFCYFTQRYIRPPYLQRIIGGSDRNHEDINYSYLVVQRGKDHRRQEHDPFGIGVPQGESATDAAFAGYESSMTMPASQDIATKDGADLKVRPPPQPATISTLGLPRTLFPPLKRRGHVILDLCTPSGLLERWTVPRSFSKQAFRDARKSQWGDLWALGAKTRVARNVRVGIGKADYEKEKGRKKAARKQKKEKHVFEIGVDAEGNVMEDNVRIKIGRKAGRKESRKEKRKERELRKELEDDNYVEAQKKKIPQGLAESLSERWD